MRAAKGAILAAVLAFSSSGCALYNGIFGVCEGQVYTAQVNQAIPDNDDVGIDSRILVPLSGLPNGIGIRLEYDHPFDSDLRLRLAHEGVVFEIDDVDNTGPFHEFDNRNVGGEWLLNVADTLSSDTGYWTSWEISICGE